MDGFRYIERRDIDLPFKTNFAPMDEFTLTDYFVWNSEEDSLSPVKEMNLDGIPVIAAVASVRVHPCYIKVDLIGRNKLFDPDTKGAGFDLLLFIEVRVARRNGYTEIKLDAVDHMVKKYEKKGYVAIPGAQYDDPKWGTLTPMTKRP
jgi:hypothetical protein